MELLRIFLSLHMHVFGWTFESQGYLAALIFGDYCGAAFNHISKHIKQVY